MSSSDMRSGGIGDGGIVPRAWDVHRDLFVLVGRGGEPLLRQFADQGQQRAIAYLPDDADTALVPEGVRIARTPIEVYDGILMMHGPLPKQVSVRRQPDPWATEDMHSEIAKTVEEALLAKRMLMATADSFGTQWLLQGIDNLHHIASNATVDALRGAFAKKPCVIISPGPSLDRNVDQLAALKGRAVLVACSHALHTLRKAGVVPDLVVVADPGPLMVRHYDGEDLSAPEALLIGATCGTFHWDQPARRFLSFASNASVDDWVFDGLGEDARLRTGGSVACSELSLALLMGCDPVIFVGQDLAFTDDRYYAAANLDSDARVKPSGDGSTFYLAKPPGTDAPGYEDADGDLQTSKKQQLVQVPGYHGGKVWTSHSFKLFLTWFETIARSQEGHTMLFNCTEGGAHIRGMQHRPLADVIAAYVRKEVDVPSVLDARTRVDVAARRARMAEHVRGMHGALLPALRQARLCRATAEKAERDPKRLPELQKAEAELSRLLKPIRFLSLIAQGDITAAQQRALEAKTLEENLAAAKTLFDVVERAGQVLRKPLAAALEALEAGEAAGA